MRYFISNQGTGLFSLSYPPFGLVTISNVDWSSYFILVGIYCSAVSIAPDMKLRRSIKNSIEQNMDILDLIGIAEIQ
jgi:hypothetical protein